MARQGTNKSSVKAQKPRKVKSATRGFSSFLKIKRTSKKTQLILTLSFPRHIKKPRATKSTQAPKKSKNLFQLAITDAVTLFLFGVGIVGLFSITRPIPTSGAQRVVIHYARPATASAAGLDRSTPLRLQVPSIKLDANLEVIGQKQDGTIAVPKQVDMAGWYDLGPSPGELGPAIIVGHVDSVRGPAVFFYLKELKPGDLIKVTRTDGKIVTFKVDKLDSYPQNSFPTQQVYGNINYPGLRLITCTGDFNYLTRHYSENIVVYASLQTK